MDIPDRQTTVVKEGRSRGLVNQTIKLIVVTNVFYKVLHRIIKY